MHKKLSNYLILSLSILFFGSILSISLFEITKSIILPHLKLWESHLITIVVISGMSVTAGFFILKKQSALKVELKLENEELKKVDFERQIQSEIVQSVTNSKDLRDLLGQIHNSLREVIYAENLFIALKDQNTGLFNFPYFVDKFDTEPAPLAMLKSCTSYIFRSGRSLIITPQVFKQLADQNEVELVGSVSPFLDRSAFKNIIKNYWCPCPSALRERRYLYGRQPQVH